MTINRKEIGQKIIKMVTYSWKDMERFTDSARTILVVRLVPSCAGRLMTARGNAAPRFLVLSGSTPDDANEDKDDVTDARKVLDVSSGRGAVLPTYHQPLCPAHSKDDARFTKSPCRKRCRANDELVSMLAEEEHPARMPPGKRFDVPGVSNSR